MPQAKIRMMPAQRRGITSAPMLTLGQKSSAAFVNGAPVRIDGSGVLAAVSASSSQGGSNNLGAIKKASTVSSALVLGLAVGSAASGATGDLSMVPFQEGQHFIGNLINGVSASSAKLSKIGGQVTLAKHNSDTHWGWANDASSTFDGSAAFASTVTGRVVQLIDPASTVNGRVAVAIAGKGGQLHGTT